MQTLTLSPFQKIWLTSNGPMQSTFATFRLDGPLNLELVKRTLSEIWHRQETLRTTIGNDGNQISLWLSGDVSPALSWIDLEALPPQERDRAVEKKVNEAAALQFNLTNKQLVRVTLIRLDPNLHLLLLAAHPIACDGTSARLFGSEFARVYQALANGASTPPPQSGFQYRDFVKSHQGWLQDGLGKSDLAYWRTQLSGQLGQGKDFGDQAPSSPIGVTASAEKITIPTSLSQDLRRLAQVHNVDIETTLLVFFQLLLHRYSGDDEVPVGVVIPGRNQHQAQEIIGCLVNHLVLRAKFSPVLTLGEILNQVFACSQLAAQHSTLSLQTVLEECLRSSETDGQLNAPNHRHLFRAVFSVQAPLVTQSFSGLVLTQLNLNEPILPSDLAMIVVDEGGEITVKLLYNPSVFSTDFAALILRHLLKALSAAVEKPNLSVEQLPLMDRAEHQKVTVEWNDTDVDHRQEACLHDLFAAQVKRTPAACAIVHRQQQLSYQEIDQWANRLGRYLQQQFDIKPDTKLAIYLEPSIELLVVIFAVLKAGGAYIPISPSMPRERVQFLLSDTKSSILITKEQFTETGLEFPCQTLLLDADADSIDRQLGSPPIHQATPENLAYVIYTSGSTGEPKGVMVSHRGIGNTLLWRQKTFPFNAADRVLLTFSFVFDASLFQLFQPLLAGACLVIPDAEHGGDPKRIINDIRRHKITVLGLTPSLLALLLNEPDFEQCDSVRIVFCGGESLSEALRSKLHRRGGIEVHNMYGPTEASMEATYWTCVPGMRVSIGRPIANVQAYVLDQQLQPLPVGVSGELYIGGAGLARGYLNQPELTAERFLPDPFTSLPGKRMYRTGDLCRWLPSGCLEYLGRQDQQVKLHGQRIELEEIEACLQRNTAVRENAVVLEEDQPGDKRLVSYVVPYRKGETNSEELRRYLRRQLPTSMIPSTFVFLESLPRTPSGKLNRRALRAPRLAPSLRTIQDWSGRPLENFLANIMQEVLGIGEVGEQDNFFDLGGNSLRAAILTHKLEEVLNEFVYTVALYDAPTIEKLSQYLRLNYPRSVVRLFGQEALNVVAPARSSAVDQTSITTLRSLIRTLPERRAVPGGAKNPSAVFILSPPRSGSTLLRVMLGGHPALFSPPELQLLNYNTLGERKAALSSERDNFWLQGTIRALMQIRGCQADEAAGQMKNFEDDNLSVKEFYRLMQDWLGQVTLVDKTPTYALDLQTLKRAEEDFENALYIHLIRHPSAAIASFEEAKLHVFFPPFLKGRHDFTVWQLAELVWDVCHQNILEFLSTIPTERKQAIRFEDLVSNPKRTMEEVAKWLNLPFHPNMINPYKQDRETLMTDATHSMARMLGDVKFHQHGQIKVEAADRNYGRYPEELLGEVTRQLALTLGYEPQDRLNKTLVGLETRGGSPTFFGVHPTGGEILCYQELARQLGPDQPFYAFRAQTLNGATAIPRSVEELASAYVRELRNLQPHGPYQLGGWSFGGLVAFEMALQLAASGEEIALLALLSSYLSKSGVSMPPPRLRDFVLGFFHEYGLDVEPTKTDGLNRSQLLQYAFALARQAGIISQQLVFSDFCRVMEQKWRVYRLHLRLGRRYVPQARLERVILLEAEDTSLDGRGPFEDWNTFATQVSRHLVPGNHFTILREPQVRHLAALLRQYLQKER